MFNSAKTQLIHHSDRASAHRQNVANDAADASCSTLKRLDITWMIVALDLEGHRPAFADIDDASVLTHADHEVLRHLGRNLLAKLAQINLAALITAVL